MNLILVGEIIFTWPRTEDLSILCFSATLFAFNESYSYIFYYALSFLLVIIPS